MDDTLEKQLSVNRWRLVLGGGADRELQFRGDEETLRTFEDMEELLDYLYGRAGGDDIREEQERLGGNGPSVLTAAKWINKVRELFPKQTADVLERHALDEFKMTELLTDKEVLKKMEPSMELLKTILQLKHLMKGEVLGEAKRIAAAVAEELRKKLENSVRRSVMGRIDRSTSSPVHSARNLDIKKTIRRNLKNYDKSSGQLILQDIYFSNRVRRYNNKTVIIAIDESGSMVGSVIYSAVMAQIFSKLPFADVKLVIFDTSVVDLTGYADEPAEILMSVQLGGGTYIGGALSYCESLIPKPSESVIICVTDLYEGGPVGRLLNISRGIIESGAKLSFLTALDQDANAVYDKSLGQKLADLGAFVGAMTPEQLGDYIGRIFS